MKNNVYLLNPTLYDLQAGHGTGRVVPEGKDQDEKK
jgi:hypothetical protein